MKNINEYNFFENSFAQFNLQKDSEILSTEPNHVSYDKFGNVSSKYWYTSKGVYRYSNHWGFVKNCRWFLNVKNAKKRYQNPVLGFSTWKSFKEMNHYENVFCNGVFNSISKKELQKIRIITEFGVFKIEKDSYGSFHITDSFSRNCLIYSYKFTIKIMKNE